MAHPGSGHVQRSDTAYFTNYALVSDPIFGGEPITSFTDSNLPGVTRRRFYRVEVP